MYWILGKNNCVQFTIAGQIMQAQIDDSMIFFDEQELNLTYNNMGAEKKTSNEDSNNIEIAKPAQIFYFCQGILKDPKKFSRLSQPRPAIGS